LATEHGVRATTDNREAVAAADVVLLALKPQTILTVVGEVAGAFHAGQTVITVAAGTTTASIESLLPVDLPVVRVMTNTPVQVDEAMSVVAAGSHATDQDLELAEEILGHVGRVVRLGEEHLNSVTALSGSGPAYFFLLAEAMIDAGILLGLPRDVSTELIVQTMAMIDAGILLGLPRDVSTELIVQTMVGSAKMLRDAGMHPVELREMVTSPGGTTIAAIRELESARVRAAFLDAIEAAKLRGEELSGQ
jgi:pyrroline-5-carboxylate reductase